MTRYHVCRWLQGTLPCFPATSERKRPSLTWLRSWEGGSLTASSSSKEPRFSQIDLHQPRSPNNFCFLPGGAADAEGGPKAAETQEHLHLLRYNQLFVFCGACSHFGNILEIRSRWYVLCARGHCVSVHIEHGPKEELRNGGRIL